MSKMKRFLASLAGLLLAFSASAQFVDCTRGLLTMPSAEMYQECTFTITNNFLNKHFLPTKGWNYNTFGYGVSITIFSRLEVAYAMTIFNGAWRPEDPSTLTYRERIMRNQDRHFAARVQVLREGDFAAWVPSVVLGISDPVTGSGTYEYIGSDVSKNNGYFNRAYIAVTKHFNTAWGDVGAHAAFQYTKRTDFSATGPCAAVTWEPVWLNREGWFMNSFRATLEYDAKSLNIGVNASIWEDRFEAMAMLYGFRWPMFGLRYKLVLKQ